MNVAIAAARLGAPAAFVGRVSTDHHGQTIWQYMLDNDVDLRAAQRGDEPTATARIEHVPHLVFHFEGENTADTNLDLVDLASLGDGPHILHGGTLGLFRGKTAETLAQLAEKHRGLVSLDPNIRPAISTNRAEWNSFHERWLVNTALYRSSDEDLAWIWPNRDAESVAEELLAGAPEVVIVTRGGDGAVLFTAQGEVKVPGQPVDVVDTVGAGDTFVAGLLTQLWERDFAGRPESLGSLSSEDWRDIGAFAVSAAAVTCSRPGADPPRRSELEPRS